MARSSVTGPSSTAAHVAFAQVLQHGRRARAFEVRCLARYGGWLRWGSAVLSVPGSRPLARVIARWRFRDTLDHVLARRDAFVRAAQQFVAAWGADAQVVQVGCGFDGSALRLAERTGCAVAMWDRDPTLAIARRAAPTVEVSWCSADLERDSEWSSAWDPARPTLFVAEGVLMYLESGSVRRLLQRVAERHRAPWVLLGTWLDSAVLSDPSSGAARVARHLEDGPEAFRWSCGRDDVANLLDGDDWRVRIEPERWPPGAFDGAPHGGDRSDAVDFPGWRTSYGEKALVATGAGQDRSAGGASS